MILRRGGAWGFPLLVAIFIAGLPVATWLDLKDLSTRTLDLQARAINSMVSDIRAFYSTSIVSRILANRGRTKVTPFYHRVPGAIPIPATFSLELGHIVGEHQGNVEYRFVSDEPFKNRAPHVLDTFEHDALTTLRAEAPVAPTRLITAVQWNGIENRVRIAAPIVMEASCVACHNADPNSPRHDWKVGDVRGLQEVSVNEPVIANIFSLRYLLAYFVLAGGIGLTFLLTQRRQTATMRVLNDDLHAKNEMLANVSSRVSRYLSPQVYESIFTGKTDASISTRRKKLTIFFSDIKDFTSTTESLQPEELTRLLNEYFTEMSRIALAHGGTIDKFVGDAMLVFFGDPETRGTAEDARAALRMALAMQERMRHLNVRWRSEGLENPFEVRMGMNTGYCDVGNFGSADRMDYTIIGAEANLASRLESSAEPGSIVISYETYVHVRDMVSVCERPAIMVKGIARPVISYVVDRPSTQERSQVFTHKAIGVDLYVDVDSLNPSEAQELRGILERTRRALDERKKT